MSTDRTPAPAMPDPGLSAATRSVRARRAATELERRHRLDAAELAERYLRTDTPVVVTGVISTWPAFERWRTPASLARRAGRAPVPLITLPDDVAPYYVVHPELPVPFDECVERIYHDRQRRHYINQIDLHAHAPHLAQDYCFPYPELDLDPGPAILWLGSAGCLSQLHFDLGHNFACLVSGTKVFRLYPPHQSHRLYARPDGKRCPISTLEDVDLGKYPAFGDARYTEVRLGAGDMLFLPGFWWHQVITEEPGVMLTWFANTREMQRDRQRLDGVATALAEARDTATLQRLISSLETDAYRNMAWAAVARAALELGQPEHAANAVGQISDRRFAEEMADVLPTPKDGSRKRGAEDATH